MNVREAKLELITVASAFHKCTKCNNDVSFEKGFGYVSTKYCPVNNTGNNKIATFCQMFKVFCQVLIVQDLFGYESENV